MENTKKFLEEAQHILFETTVAIFPTQLCQECL